MSDEKQHDEVTPEPHEAHAAWVASGVPSVLAGINRIRKDHGVGFFRAWFLYMAIEMWQTRVWVYQLTLTYAKWAESMSEWHDRMEPRLDRAFRHMEEEMGSEPWKEEPLPDPDWLPDD